MVKKFGFTLAEVLITLGIIGVVAAMTIPSLINKTNKQELHAQMKKVYSELGQINLRFISDFDMNMCEYEWNNIASTGTDYSGKALPAQFSKYLTEGSGNSKNGGCNGYHDMYTLTGEKLTNTQLFDDGCYIDGMGRRYYFEYSRQTTNKCPIITVDVNGTKKPNRMGYDIFMFRPTKDGRIIGMGKTIKEYDTVVEFGGISNMDTAEKYCNYNASGSLNGFGCAYYALIDRHPFDSSKTYWKDFIK